MIQGIDGHEVDYFRQVLDLGKTVKAALQKQGMLAWQYNTVGVSDAITMGGEGLCPWMIFLDPPLI